MGQLDQKSRLLLIGIMLLVCGLLAVCLLWRGDNLYSGAYSPMVEKSLQRQGASGTGEGQNQKEKQSDQPQAPGFREKDINRQHGEGFSTY
jgi:hypothetical protein